MRKDPANRGQGAPLSWAALHPKQIPEAKKTRIAVVGRSNAGKSSLLNLLTHPKKVFRSGKRPGLTRGLLAVEKQLGKSEASTIELVDFPGWGFAKRTQAEQKQWAGLAEVFVEKSQSAPLLWVWVVDPKKKIFEEEEQFFDFIGQQLFLLVWSRADKVKKAQRAALVDPWKVVLNSSIEEGIWLSNVSKEGLDGLKRSLRAFCGG